MAASGRRAGPAVIEDLARNPCRFDAFQVVRLLEMWARRREAEPDRPRFVPVGQDGPPDREPVRFRTLPSHTFPPSSICSLELRKPEEELPPGPLAQVTVSFLGLIGPNGALPHHYTSLVIERLRAKDRSLRDFLDLFNHRLISLFYRAWEKYRVRTSRRERPSHRSA
ncbi:MAG: type VI secretion system baseplate subunit TssG [Planctomycetes bacterium]|nr:type VI secretion system baseplate subunit TssG [Planctomycetota bacterium]